METVLPNASQEVQPEEVERMLRKIWSEAAQIDEKQDVGGEHPPRLRTILSNFIIIQTDVPRQKVDELISELCFQYPSRFFLISFDSSLPAETISTSVSSRCVLTLSGQHVCSEEVHIRCGERSYGNVGSLLRSLFVPDVQIFALVFGDPFQPTENTLAELLPQMREMCDLFLYDSQLFKDYVKGSELLLSLRREGTKSQPWLGRGRGHFGVGVRDLGWYRTQRYRGLIAERFDAGMYHELVPEISKLRVLSGRTTKDPRGYLLAGWISAVLGWTVASRTDVGVTCTSREGKRVEVEFLKGEHEELFEISLHAGESIFSVQFNKNTSTYEVSSSLGGGGKLLERSLTVPQFDTADLIVAPVQSSGLDDFFTRSLERSLEIAR